MAEQAAAGAFQFFDDEGFFFDELRVLPVRVKRLQVAHQALPVPAQVHHDFGGLPRVRHENFEHMERLELDVLALVDEEVHHLPQVVLGRNKAHHHTEVCAVEEELRKKFEGLPPGEEVAPLPEQPAVQPHQPRGPYLASAVTASPATAIDGGDDTTTAAAAAAA
eukprot:CAMPEP_0171914654 /NCGR_PEP_ID=MMETSP0993-20121228/13067_1 /TAXON_ID=483369 /ORGANISM="non described non described, Strain CCMP2098" /LENGTH=164 /DNA_ID=CAMNT_0012549289 /DNA_START=189 /DNA_END=680 /DNA_ORIENTATION=+